MKNARQTIAFSGAGLERFHPKTTLARNIMVNQWQRQHHQHKPSSRASVCSNQRWFQHTTTKAATHHYQGYQSMGSFHSDNLGEIMAMEDKDYQAPDLPFHDNSSSTASSSNDSKSSDFLVDRENWTFLNHGAFGAALKVGYHRSEQWRWYLEQQPLRYFDRALLPHLAHATRRLAANCSTNTSTRQPEIRQGITLIQNATSGLNSVLRGFAREYGDSAHVILWDTSYGSLKKLAQRVLGSHRVTEIPFQKDYLSRFATSAAGCTGDKFHHYHQVFLDALQDTMSAAHPDCKTGGSKHFLLVLDHTTSNTAINMPINVIADHAKETFGNDNMTILVDGAHGLLAQDVNLDDFFGRVDFYVANGHKWLSCPRGVGMLFCSRPDLSDSILAEPAIISHGVDEPDLLSRFVWDGCRDYSAALSLPAVLDYWQAYGPSNVVRNIMKEKLMKGVQILANHWHGGCTETEWLEQRVTIVPTSLLSPMALVRLPNTLCGNESDIKSSADAKRIQDFLFDQWIEVPIKCINGELFVRVSCHVYNDNEDFDRLGKVLAAHATQL